MLCLLENGALQRVAHLCIHVSGDGYLWSGFNSAELLSITCRTTNISVAMVGSSPPKFCLHFWKQCIAKGCISLYSREHGWYDWTGFNSVELLSSTYRTTNMTWLNSAELCQPSPTSLDHCIVLRSASVATLESFIPIFPYKLFSESLQVQDVVTFSQHQCKITRVQLCFQGLHQWLPIW